MIPKKAIVYLLVGLVLAFLAIPISLEYFINSSNQMTRLRLFSPGELLILPLMKTWAWMLVTVLSFVGTGVFIAFGVSELASSKSK